MAIVQRLKPQPEMEANPRAVIGANNPPLEEQITIDLAEALEVEGITKRIGDLLASAGRAPTVITDADMAGSYADLVKQMVAAGKAVEAQREILNRPLLNAQRALKGRADAIVEPLQSAEATARARIRTFDDAEREKERQRQIEAQRVADAERQRLQAIADAEAAKERARLQAIEDARAAAEAREATVVEVEPEVVEVAPEPIVETAAPVVRGDYGAKVVRTTTYKHRIVSVRQLPDSILKHAKVVEAIDKVIAAQVRGGTRELKGCEIFPETGTTIR
ncbi:hypothetical protein SKP52_02415 [Sphingopyxis fribergensis]|uniref:Uncharacterized protein n=1 Tax=Sphingopyxis fribergensis TaxID=1515612 RepID=A0A0A7PDV7_9SPHN|nr:hypothetical protein [Sphingopyxis fribergensis]AJA07418.1 hypothetical protein SKP52_02415 [Sphingopyxis fribergensis]